MGFHVSDFGVSTCTDRSEQSLVEVQGLGFKDICCKNVFSRKCHKCRFRLVHQLIRDGKAYCKVCFSYAQCSMPPRRIYAQSQPKP